MRRPAFRPYLLVVFSLAVAVASATAVETTVLTVVALVGMPLMLMLCFLLPVPVERSHRVLDSSAMVLVAVAIAASVVFTHWPLRLSYLAARPALDSLAVEVRSGRRLSLPVRVGLLSIVDAGIHDRGGVVCLWTDGNPGGRSGFVRTSPEKVDSQFNLWSSVALGGDWQFIHED